MTDTSTAKCRYCGKAIEYDARSDTQYCRDDSSCRSKYHQESPRDYRANTGATEMLVHEPKPHVHHFTCVVCGSGFQVNDYADRSGKRSPLYCTRACKQKAYRLRKKGDVK